MTEIKSTTEVPSLDSSDELADMLDEVKRIRKDGEGWYDACLRVADNDAQTVVLTQLMLREVRKDRN